MYTNTFSLIDDKGVVRSVKRRVGHIQSAFSDIKMQEEITYPWRVESDLAKDVLIITKDTTLQDWRDFREYCEMLED